MALPVCAAAHRRWCPSETLDSLRLASGSLSAECIPSTWFCFPFVSQLAWIGSVSSHAMWLEPSEMLSTSIHRPSMAVQPHKWEVANEKIMQVTQEGKQQAGPHWLRQGSGCTCGFQWMVFTMYRLRFLFVYFFVCLAWVSPHWRCICGQGLSFKPKLTPG